jgi:hypothetical protein
VGETAIISPIRVSSNPTKQAYITPPAEKYFQYYAIIPAMEVNSHKKTAQGGKLK